jgi:hypothetical protein
MAWIGHVTIGFFAVSACRVGAVHCLRRHRWPAMTDSGAPLRLRGIVRFTDRGPLLETEDGPVWRLETADDLHAHRDRTVRIEAWQRGASLLELLWIGPATE